MIDAGPRAHSPIATRLEQALADHRICHMGEAGPEAMDRSIAEVIASRQAIETPEETIARFNQESRETWDRAQAQRALWDGYVDRITYRLKNGDPIGAAMLERTADGVLRHVNRLEADSDRLAREAALIKFNVENLAVLRAVAS